MTTQITNIQNTIALLNRAVENDRKILMDLHQKIKCKGFIDQGHSKAIGILDGKITELNKKLERVNDLIHSLELDEIKKEVDKATAAGNAASEAADKAEKAVGEVDKKIKEIQDKIDTIDQYDDRMKVVEKWTGLNPEVTLENGGANLVDGINKVYTDTISNKSEIDNVKGALNTHIAKMDETIGTGSLDTKFKSNNVIDALNELLTESGKIDGEIKDLEKRVATNEANISTNTADIATNKTNIEKNTNDIADNKSNIGAIQTDIKKILKDIYGSESTDNLNWDDMKEKFPNDNNIHDALKTLFDLIDSISGGEAGSLAEIQKQLQSVKDQIGSWDMTEGEDHFPGDGKTIAEKMKDLVDQFGQIITPTPPGQIDPDYDEEKCECGCSDCDNDKGNCTCGDGACPDCSCNVVDPGPGPGGIKPGLSATNPMPVITRAALTLTDVVNLHTEYINQLWENEQQLDKNIRQAYSEYKETRDELGKFSTESGLSGTVCSVIETLKSRLDDIDECDCDKDSIDKIKNFLSLNPDGKFLDADSLENSPFATLQDLVSAILEKASESSPVDPDDPGACKCEEKWEKIKDEVDYEDFKENHDSKSMKEVIDIILEKLFGKDDEGNPNIPEEPENPDDPENQDNIDEWRKRIGEWDDETTNGEKYKEVMEDQVKDNADQIGKIKEQLGLTDDEQTEDTGLIEKVKELMDFTNQAKWSEDVDDEIKDKNITEVVEDLYKKLQSGECGCDEEDMKKLKKIIEFINLNTSDGVDKIYGNDSASTLKELLDDLNDGLKSKINSSTGFESWEDEQVDKYEGKTMKEIIDLILAKLFPSDEDGNPELPDEGEENDDNIDDWRKRVGECEDYTESNTLEDQVKANKDNIGEWNKTSGNDNYPGENKTITDKIKEIEEKINGTDDNPGIEEEIEEIKNDYLPIGVKKENNDLVPDSTATMNIKWVENDGNIDLKFTNGNKNVIFNHDVDSDNSAVLLVTKNSDTTNVAAIDNDNMRVGGYESMGNDQTGDLTTVSKDEITIGHKTYRGPTNKSDDQLKLTYNSLEIKNNSKDTILTKIENDKITTNEITANAIIGNDSNPYKDVSETIETTGYLYTSERLAFGEKSTTLTGDATLANPFIEKDSTKSDKLIIHNDAEVVGELNVGKKLVVGDKVIYDAEEEEQEDQDLQNIKTENIKVYADGVLDKNSVTPAENNWGIEIDLDQNKPVILMKNIDETTKISTKIELDKITVGSENYATEITDTGIKAANITGNNVNPEGSSPQFAATPFIYSATPIAFNNNNATGTVFGDTARFSAPFIQQAKYNSDTLEIYNNLDIMKDLNVGGTTVVAENLVVKGETTINGKINQGNFDGPINLATNDKLIHSNVIHMFSGSDWEKIESAKESGEDITVNEQDCQLEIGVKNENDPYIQVTPKLPDDGSITEQIVTISKNGLTATRTNGDTNFATVAISNVPGSQQLSISSNYNETSLTQFGPDGMRHYIGEKETLIKGDEITTGNFVGNETQPTNSLHVTDKFIYLQDSLAFGEKDKNNAGLEIDEYGNPYIRKSNTKPDKLEIHKHLDVEGNLNVGNNLEVVGTTTLNDLIVNGELTIPGEVKTKETTKIIDTNTLHFIPDKYWSGDDDKGELDPEGRNNCQMDVGFNGETNPSIKITTPGTDSDVLAVISDQTIKLQNADGSQTMGFTIGDTDNFVVNIKSEDEENKVIFNKDGLDVENKSSDVTTKTSIKGNEITTDILTGNSNKLPEENVADDRFNDEKMIYMNEKFVVFGNPETEKLEDSNIINPYIERVDNKTIKIHDNLEVESKLVVGGQVIYDANANDDGSEEEDSPEDPEEDKAEGGFDFSKIKSKCVKIYDKNEDNETVSNWTIHLDGGEEKDSESVLPLIELKEKGSRDVLTSISLGTATFKKDNGDEEISGFVSTEIDGNKITTKSLVADENKENMEDPQNYEGEETVSKSAIFMNSETIIIGDAENQGKELAEGKSLNNPYVERVDDETLRIHNNLQVVNDLEVGHKLTVGDYVIYEEKTDPEEDEEEEKEEGPTFNLANIKTECIKVYENGKSDVPEEENNWYVHVDIDESIPGIEMRNPEETIENGINKANIQSTKIVLSNEHRDDGEGYKDDVVDTITIDNNSIKFNGEVTRNYDGNSKPSEDISYPGTEINHQQVLVHELHTNTEERMKDKENEEGVIYINSKNTVFANDKHEEILEDEDLVNPYIERVDHETLKIHDNLDIGKKLMINGKVIYEVKDDEKDPDDPQTPSEEEEDIPEDPDEDKTEDGFNFDKIRTECIKIYESGIEDADKTRSNWSIHLDVLDKDESHIPVIQMKDRKDSEIKTEIGVSSASFNFNETKDTNDVKYETIIDDAKSLTVLSTTQPTGNSDETKIEKLETKIEPGLITTETITTELSQLPEGFMQTDVLEADKDKIYENKQLSLYADTQNLVFGDKSNYDDAVAWVEEETEEEYTDDDGEKKTRKVVKPGYFKRSVTLHNPYIERVDNNKLTIHDNLDVVNEITAQSATIKGDLKVDGTVILTSGSFEAATNTRVINSNEIHIFNTNDVKDDGVINEDNCQLELRVNDEDMPIIRLQNKAVGGDRDASNQTIIERGKMTIDYKNSKSDSTDTNYTYTQEMNFGQDDEKIELKVSKLTEKDSQDPVTNSYQLSFNTENGLKITKDEDENLMTTIDGNEITSTYNYDNVEGTKTLHYEKTSVVNGSSIVATTKVTDDTSNTKTVYSSINGATIESVIDSQANHTLIDGGKFDLINEENEVLGSIQTETDSYNQTRTIAKESNFNINKDENKVNIEIGENVEYKDSWENSLGNTRPTDSSKISSTFDSADKYHQILIDSDGITSIDKNSTQTKIYGNEITSAIISSNLSELPEGKNINEGEYTDKDKVSDENEKQIYLNSNNLVFGDHSRYEIDLQEEAKDPSQPNDKIWVNKTTLHNPYIERVDDNTLKIHDNLDIVNSLTINGNKVLTDDDQLDIQHIKATDIRIYSEEKYKDEDNDEKWRLKIDVDEKVDSQDEEIVDEDKPLILIKKDAENEANYKNINTSVGYHNIELANYNEEGDADKYNIKNFTQIDNEKIMIGSADDKATVSTSSPEFANHDKYTEIKQGQIVIANAKSNDFMDYSSFNGSNSDIRYEHARETEINNTSGNKYYQDSVTETSQFKMNENPGSGIVEKAEFLFSKNGLRSTWENSATRPEQGNLIGNGGTYYNENKVSIDINGVTISAGNSNSTDTKFDDIPIPNEGFGLTSNDVYTKIYGNEITSAIISSNLNVYPEDEEISQENDENKQSHIFMNSTNLVIGDPSNYTNEWDSSKIHETQIHNPYIERIDDHSIKIHNRLIVKDLEVTGTITDDTNPMKDLVNEENIDVKEYEWNNENEKFTEDETIQVEWKYPNLKDKTRLEQKYVNSDSENGKININNTEISALLAGTDGKITEITTGSKKDVQISADEIVLHKSVYDNADETSNALIISNDQVNITEDENNNLTISIKNGLANSIESTDSGSGDVTSKFINASTDAITSKISITNDSTPDNNKSYGNIVSSSLFDDGNQFNKDSNYNNSSELYADELRIKDNNQIKLDIPHEYYIHEEDNKKYLYKVEIKENLNDSTIFAKSNELNIQENRDTTRKYNRVRVDPGDLPPEIKFSDIETAGVKELDEEQDEIRDEIDIKPKSVTISNNLVSGSDITPQNKIVVGIDSVDLSTNEADKLTVVNPDLIQIIEKGNDDKFQYRSYLTSEKIVVDQIGPNYISDDSYKQLNVAAPMMLVNYDNTENSSINPSVKNNGEELEVENIVKIFEQDIQTGNNPVIFKFVNSDDQNDYPVTKITGSQNPQDDKDEKWVGILDNLYVKGKIIAGDVETGGDDHNHEIINTTEVNFYGKDGFDENIDPENIQIQVISGENGEIKEDTNTNTFSVENPGSGNINMKYIDYSIEGGASSVTDKNEIFKNEHTVKIGANAEMEQKITSIRDYNGQKDVADKILASSPDEIKISLDEVSVPSPGFGQQYTRNDIYSKITPTSIITANIGGNDDGFVIDGNEGIKHLTLTSDLAIKTENEGKPVVVMDKIFATHINTSSTDSGASKYDITDEYVYAVEEKLQDSAVGNDLELYVGGTVNLEKYVPISSTDDSENKYTWAKLDPTNQKVQIRSVPYEQQISGSDTKYHYNTEIYPDRSTIGKYILDSTGVHTTAEILTNIASSGFVSYANPEANFDFNDSADKKNKSIIGLYIDGNSEHQNHFFMFNKGLEDSETVTSDNIAKHCKSLLSQGIANGVLTNLPSENVIDNGGIKLFYEFVANKDNGADMFTSYLRDDGTTHVVNYSNTDINYLVTTKTLPHILSAFYRDLIFDNLEVSRIPLDDTEEGEEIANKLTLIWRQLFDNTKNLLPSYSNTLAPESYYNYNVNSITDKNTALINLGKLYDYLGKFFTTSPPSKLTLKYDSTYGELLNLLKYVQTDIAEVVANQKTSQKNLVAAILIAFEKLLEYENQLLTTTPTFEIDSVISGIDNKKISEVLNEMKQANEANSYSATFASIQARDEKMQNYQIIDSDLRTNVPVVATRSLSATDSIPSIEMPAVKPILRIPDNDEEEEEEDGSATLYSASYKSNKKYQWFDGSIYVNLPPMSIKRATKLMYEIRITLEVDGRSYQFSPVLNSSNTIEYVLSRRIHFENPNESKIKYAIEYIGGEKDRLFYNGIEIVDSVLPF